MFQSLWLHQWEICRCCFLCSQGVWLIRDQFRNSGTAPPLISSGIFSGQSSSFKDHPDVQQMVFPVLQLDDSPHCRVRGTGCHVVSSSTLGAFLPKSNSWSNPGLSHSKWWGALLLLPKAPGWDGYWHTSSVQCIHIKQSPSLPLTGAKQDRIEGWDRFKTHPYTSGSPEEKQGTVQEKGDGGSAYKGPLSTFSTQLHSQEEKMCCHWGSTLFIL